MRIRNHFVVSVAVFCMLAVPLMCSQAEAPTSGASAQQEIEKLQTELVQAFLNNEVGVLDKYYADDYVSIPANGTLLTKIQELENYKSGRVRYNSIAVRESAIRTYGDTAVVNVLLSVKVTNNGQQYTGDLRNTRVWVKRDGVWRVVAFQATRVSR